MFKYANGMMAMVDTSRDASYGYDQRIEVFGEKGMLTAHNELTSTVELATSAGHLRPPGMYSFPQRYLQAYRSELTEFIELVRAGSDSEARAMEQVAMLRHPGVVRATMAAKGCRALVEAWAHGAACRGGHGLVRIRARKDGGKEHVRRQLSQL